MKASFLGFALILFTVTGCNASGAIQQRNAKSSNEAECDECKWLIDTAETYLGSPANQQLLVQFMITSVCPQLQDPLRQQCMDYSPILVPTAVLWINTNLPPATVCTDLAMCSVMKGIHSVLLQLLWLFICGSSSRFHLLSICSFLCHFESIKIGTTLCADDLAIKSQIAEDISQENGVPCPVCKFILAQLLSQIQDPSIQNSIELSALQMCSLLEPPLQQDCHENIQDMTRKAFVILADVSVDKACLAMKACEPFPSVASLKQLAAPGLMANKHITKLLADVHHLAIQTRAASNDGPQCQECQMVVAELKSLIGNPDTRKNIIDGMKAACGVLQAFEASCNKAVDDYGELIFNMALLYVEDPPTTCAQLSFCASAIPDAFAAESATY